MTTEAVLTEFLNFFSEYGAVARRKTARIVQGILARADVEVVQQKHDDFVAAIALYDADQTRVTVTLIAFQCSSCASAASRTSSRTTVILPRKGPTFFYETQ